MSSQTRLIYIWVDSYKLLNNIGFCLVDDYKINYDKDVKKLNIQRSESYPECLAELKDLSAIVGPNGSGKTTYLEVINQAVEFGWIDCGFALFEIEGTIYCSFKKNSITECMNLKLSVGLSEYSNVGFSSQKVVNKQPIPNFNIIRIDTIDHLKQDNGSTVGSLLACLKQLSPYLDNLEFSSKVRVNYPLKKLDMLELYDEAREEYNECYSNDNIVSFPAKELVKQYLPKSIMNLRDDIEKLSEGVMRTPLTTIAYLAIKTLRSHFVKFNEYAFYFDLLFIESLVTDTDDVIDIIDGIIRSEKMSQLPLTFDKDNSQINKKYIISVIESIKKLVSNNLDHLKTTDDGQTYFQFYTDEKNIIKDFDGIASQLNRNNEEFKLLSHAWEGISSGQLSLLTLFSNLQKQIRECRSESIIVAIDEPELTLHPEWQRKLIDTLLNFIKTVKEFEQKHIQIILTSHSPFILSDILNSNVLYMGDTDCPKKSFASNIHELLLDNFFMTRSIGEVAATLIFDTHTFLTEDEVDNKCKVKSLPDAIAVVNEVTDYMLKTELEELIVKKKRKLAFSQRFTDDSSKDECLQYLKDLIDKGEIDLLFDFIKDN